MTISVIVFDLDDTLYPEKKFVISGFRAVDQWMKNRNISGFFDLAWEIFCSGKRNNIFNLTLDQLNIHYDKKDIKRMVDIYHNHTPNIDLFKDAKIFLDKIKGQYHTAILTDGFKQVQRKKLAALGLPEKVEYIIVTDELAENRQHWKPSPVGYQKIMKKFSALPAQCLYIGDNPQKDFKAPNDLGWHSIRIYRENGEYSLLSPLSGYEPNHTMIHFDHIEQFFH